MRRYLVLAACCVGAGLALIQAQERQPGKPSADLVPLRENMLSLDLGDGVKMEFVRIKAGSFLMGSPGSDKEAYDNEKPQHEVMLTRDYYLGRCAATRGQFRAFVSASGYQTEAEKDGKGGWGYDSEKRLFFQNARYSWRDPGFDQTDNHPVVNVSWNDANDFCEWLSRKTGRKCGLPTDAQWEYACRAGTSTRFYHGDDEDGLKDTANIADLSLKAKWDYSHLDNKIFQKAISEWFERMSWDDGYAFAAPVGQFKPNKFGLYDMHANVWQWCADRYEKDYYAKSPKTDPEGPSNGQYRVLRGGSCIHRPGSCRSAFRAGIDPSSRSHDIGFRVLVRLD
jgi:formylglycine-generating enzyme required for sulfatase activity